MFNKVNNSYILLGSVILIALAVFVIFCVIKSKEKRESYTSSRVIQGCKVAPAITFPEIPNNKECPSSVINTGIIKASYILFIRHCDRGYNPKGIPEDTKYKDCVHLDNNKCFGCQRMDTLATKNGKPTCATNNCSEKGVKRSWALGKWINCFARDKGLSISTVIGEIFVKGESNQRPHTTAAIIYESLMNLNHSPCWFIAKKDNSDHAIKKYVRSDNVENKIVVVVWNHGGLPGLINDVTSLGSPSWNECCFDKVVVMDNIHKKLTSYDAKSLEEADLCGSPCKNDDKSISPYVTSNGETCSYAIFGDSTPCTVPDSTICTSEQSCTDTSVCTCPSGSRCGDYGKCCSQDCTNVFCDQRNECGETCGCRGEGQYCDGYKRCLPCKTNKDCDFMNQNCNTVTGECVDKSFPPESDCYKEGENPFGQHCAKSSCCPGTQLRLHPKEGNIEPYYICSSDATLPTNITPKCGLGTSSSCLASSFCQTKQPTGEDLCEPEYNKDCAVNYWRCKYTDITSGCWPENQKTTAVNECRKHNNADICKKH